MNIATKSSFHSSVNFFKENVLTFLTSQQKRTVIIALTALSCLAAALYMAYYICFKPKKMILPDGQTQITYRDGTVETGKFFKDNVLEGQGRRVCKIQMPEYYCWVDRVLYSLEQIEEGNFSRGKLNGPGKIIRKTKTEENQIGTEKVREGQYINGTLYTGKLIDPDGTIREGSFVDNDLKGPGTIRYPDGRVKQGNFHLNCLEGPGTVTYPDGRIERGTFTLSQLLGEGVVIYPNGKEEPKQFVHNIHDLPLFSFND